MTRQFLNPIVPILKVVMAKCKDRIVPTRNLSEGDGEERKRREEERW